MKDKTANLGMIDFEEAATIQNNLVLRPPGTKFRAVPPTGVAAAAAG
jgi:hypothetical protein